MLKERQKLILEFCRDGKTSGEIAERIRMAHASVYPELRALQQMGLLEKQSVYNFGKPRGPRAMFITVGTQSQIEFQDRPEYDPEIVNVDFIKHSHNIWRQAA
ncbi:hypothetical protein UFOVP66_25 [uncultured Caudovirales phage]|uniref:Uncharacterized protein n=1 Tax=uncultured Caudovirales phage TaxID=2100421 RepID=A0A6J5KUT7_9CAUD|nr:hypothetical protein UFOVP66_25 [uncultured Caudovirales phage]